MGRRALSLQPQPEQLTAWEVVGWQPQHSKIEEWVEM
jgi:hypothetical protein